MVEAKYVFFILIFFAVVGMFVLRPKKERSIPVLDYISAMEVFEGIIQRELRIRNDAYELGKVKIPSKYEEEVLYLVRRIMESTSPFIIEQLEFYYTRQYIISKVNSDVQQFVIGYIRANAGTSRRISAPK